MNVQVGDNMTEEDAAAAARLIALNMLATLKCEYTYSKYRYTRATVEMARFGRNVSDDGTPQLDYLC